MIARLEVTRGPLTEYPLAEKVRGGWQNGVTFYPDADVTKVTPLRVVPSEPQAEPSSEVPEPSAATDARGKYTDAQVLYMLCLALEEGLEGVRDIDLPDVLLKMISEHWGTTDEDTSPDEAEAAFAQLEPYIPDHLRTQEPQAEPSDAHLSNVSINGVRQTWQQLYESEHEAHVALQGYRTMLADLDRNATGRHQGDYDTLVPGGISEGNPHLTTGAVIGYDIGGRAYVVPEPRDRGTLSAWVRAAGGER